MPDEERGDSLYGRPARAESTRLESRSDRRTVSETSAEPFHPPAGVDDLLLARVERVALSANVDVDVLAQRGSGLDDVAAATGSGDFRVDGMNTWFHAEISPMGSGERSVGGRAVIDKPLAPSCGARRSTGSHGERYRIPDSPFRIPSVAQPAQGMVNIRNPFSISTAGGMGGGAKYMPAATPASAHAVPILSSVA